MQVLCKLLCQNDGSVKKNSTLTQFTPEKKTTNLITFYIDLCTSLCKYRLKEIDFRILTGIICVCPHSLSLKYHNLHLVYKSIRIHTMSKPIAQFGVYRDYRKERKQGFGLKCFCIYLKFEPIYVCCLPFFEVDSRLHSNSFVKSSDFNACHIHIGWSTQGFIFDFISLVIPAKPCFRRK